MPESEDGINALARQLQDLLQSEALSESNRGSDESKATLERCWKLLGTIAEKDITMRDRQFTTSSNNGTGSFRGRRRFFSKEPGLNIENMDDKSLEDLVSTTVRNAGLEPTNYAALANENSQPLQSSFDPSEETSLENEAIYARCLAATDYLKVSSETRDSERKLLDKQFKKNLSKMATRIKNTSATLASTEGNLELLTEKASAITRVYLQGLHSSLQHVQDELNRENGTEENYLENEIDQATEWENYQKQLDADYVSWESQYLQKKGQI